MKKVKLTILAALSLVLFLGFTGCQENATSPNDYGFDAATYTIPDFETQINGTTIDEATTEKEMGLRPPVEDNRRWAPDLPFFLGRILRQLELTDEQKEQIKEFIADHRDCVKEQMLILRQSEKAIIEAANAARQEIMEKLRAGEITREEAWKALAKLNESTREAMKNNPVRAEVMAALEECRDTLFSSIKSVLTEEQLAKFLAWLEKFKEFVKDRRMGKGPNG